MPKLWLLTACCSTFIFWFYFEENLWKISAILLAGKSPLHGVTQPKRGTSPGACDHRKSLVVAKFVLRFCKELPSFQPLGRHTHIALIPSALEELCLQDRNILSSEHIALDSHSNETFITVEVSLLWSLLTGFHPQAEVSLEIWRLP